MSSSAKSSSQVAMIGDFCVFNFFPAKPANIRFFICFFFPFFPKNSFRVFSQHGFSNFIQNPFHLFNQFLQKYFADIIFFFSAEKHRGEIFPNSANRKKAKAARNMMLNLRCFFPNALFSFLQNAFKISVNDKGNDCCALNFFESHDRLWRGKNRFYSIINAKLLMNFQSFFGVE